MHLFMTSENLVLIGNNDGKFGAEKSLYNHITFEFRVVTSRRRNQLTVHGISKNGLII